MKKLKNKRGIYIDRFESDSLENKKQLQIFITNYYSLLYVI
tara:strand:- start:13187 stop:13309 length:123 start_codon:yes stop_codon:yes gene_type:complete